ncbi:MAG: phospholipase D-like domain-containing protein [Acidimicrobiales bacterium]
MDVVRTCLAASGLSASPAEWLRHLRTLAVVDSAGRLDRRRAAEVGTALDLVGDSFDLAPPRATWAPVATLPPEIRLLMRPPPVRQTAGVLLGLIDRSTECITLAAPFVDSAAVHHLRGSLVAAMRRGVRVKVLTSIGRGGEWTPRVDDALGTPRCNLTVTELHTEISTLGSHAKVLLVDRTEGYVGSANLTAAGLGRHVEIGVELSGPQVDELARLLAAVERLGTRVVSVGAGVLRR